eukprot:363169-Chlamydomonas_euryale.AAC.51
MLRRTFHKDSTAPRDQLFGLRAARPRELRSYELLFEGLHPTCDLIAEPAVGRGRLQGAHARALPSRRVCLSMAALNQSARG